nr:hypothetical protein [Tanacetum cinerariifolium]
MKNEINHLFPWLEKDRWTDFPLELSIPGISLKRPLSKVTVHHQESPNSLRKSATSSKKETRHYTKLGNGIMTYCINVPLMTSITIRRNIESSSNSEGIAAIVNKLENLGRDIKKLKENVHAIQAGCQTCEGAHLDKDCPLNEEVKGMEEVKYAEFSRSFPNNIYDEASRETHDKIIQGLEGKKSNNDSKREELEWENLSLNDWMRIRYDKVCKMTEERILKDYWRERFGDKEDDLDKNLEGLEKCREDKANTILGVIHDKLNNDWFNNTSKDEDDLEGILDYLKPRSYDGFIDLDDEAYNKRRCRLLGMTYEEPTLILIKKAKVTRYTIGPGETYTKVKVLGVEKIPRTRDNVAAMRTRLMKKIAQEGNNQART